MIRLLFRCAEKVKHLPINLQEAPVEVLDQLSNAGANGVTHIFYTAFVETGDEVENAKVNEQMFKTLIEVLILSVQGCQLQRGDMMSLWQPCYMLRQNLSQSPMKDRCDPQARQRRTMAGVY